MKAKDVLLYLGIVSYLLAIAEHLLNLGILTWLYSTINETIVFYSLIIIGTAFIITYALVRTRRKGFFVATGRSRPSWAHGEHDYTTDDYGVEWNMFVPPRRHRTSRPWADGPYCKKCKRELEEKKIGRIFKKLIWYCPICNKWWLRPEGDINKEVEKDFAAYLRKNGEL